MPKESRFQFRCDPDIIARLKALATHRRRTMSSLVTDILLEYLETEESRLGIDAPSGALTTSEPIRGYYTESDIRELANQISEEALKKVLEVREKD